MRREEQQGIDRNANPCPAPNCPAKEKMTMRKVSVRIYDSPRKQWVEDVLGEFHCWGQGYEEFQSGPGNFTMAIVELPGGRIVTAMPEDVRFTDN